MNEHSEAKKHGGAHRHDHESDPAHNDEVGSDWVDEGGATPQGPATHVATLAGAENGEVDEVAADK